MELLQLEYFCVVARHSHITKAAEELYITQPSLSNSIHRLEQEVGVPLFDRKGRKIQLNEYGRIFLEGVTSALRTLENSKAKIKQRQQEHRERVRVIAPLSLQAYPQLITPLVEICPNLSFVTDDLSESEIVNALKNEAADFYIHAHLEGQELKEPVLDRVKLTSEEAFIIVSDKHHLAGRTEVELTSLQEEAFACGGAQKGQFIAFCKRAGFSPHILFEGAQLRDVLLAVRAGQYLSLATKNACIQSGIPMDSFRFLRFSDHPYKLERFLYWRKGDTSPVKAMARQAIVTFFRETQNPLDAAEQA